MVLIKEEKKKGGGWVEFQYVHISSEPVDKDNLLAKKFHSGLHIISKAIYYALSK